MSNIPHRNLMRGVCTLRGRSKRQEREEMIICDNQYFEDWRIIEPPQTPMHSSLPLLAGAFMGPHIPSKEPLCERQKSPAQPRLCRDIGDPPNIFKALDPPPMLTCIPDCPCPLCCMMLLKLALFASRRSPVAVCRRLARRVQTVTILW